MGAKRVERSPLGLEPSFLPLETRPTLPVGVEPTTLGLEVRCASPLRHESRCTRAVMLRRPNLVRVEYCFYTTGADGRGGI